MNKSELLRTVVIGCEHSAGAALDALRAEGVELPAGVTWLSVPCGASVDALSILRAFEHGAERVLVLVCQRGACRSEEGDIWAERRVATARRLLDQVGLGSWRVELYHIAPNMGVDILQRIRSFQERAAEEPAD